MHFAIKAYVRIFLYSLLAFSHMALSMQLGFSKEYDYYHRQQMVYAAHQSLVSNQQYSGNQSSLNQQAHLASQRHGAGTGIAALRLDMQAQQAQFVNKLRLLQAHGKKEQLMEQKNTLQSQYKRWFWWDWLFNGSDIKRQLNAVDSILNERMTELLWTVKHGTDEQAKAAIYEIRRLSPYRYIRETESSREAYRDGKKGNNHRMYADALDKRMAIIGFDELNAAEVLYARRDPNAIITIGLLPGEDEGELSFASPATLQALMQSPTDMVVTAPVPLSEFALRVKNSLKVLENVADISSCKEQIEECLLTMQKERLLDLPARQKAIRREVIKDFFTTLLTPSALHNAKELDADTLKYTVLGALHVLASDVIVKNETAAELAETLKQLSELKCAELSRHELLEKAADYFADSLYAIISTKVAGQNVPRNHTKLNSDFFTSIEALQQKKEHNTQQQASYASLEAASASTDMKITSPTSVDTFSPVVQQRIEESLKALGDVKDFSLYMDQVKASLDKMHKEGLLNPVDLKETEVSHFVQHFLASLVPTNPLKHPKEFAINAVQYTAFAALHVIASEVMLPVEAAMIITRSLQKLMELSSADLTEMQIVEGAAELLADTVYVVVTNKMATAISAKLPSNHVKLDTDFFQKSIDKCQECPRLKTTEGLEIPFGELQQPAKDAGMLLRSKKNGGKTQEACNASLELMNDTIPDFIKRNRVPTDAETILQKDRSFQKTNFRYDGATIYQKGKHYYYRDNFHTGKAAHLEVFAKKNRRHVGEANPLTGEIIPNTKDPSKSLKGVL